MPPEGQTAPQGYRLNKCGGLLVIIVIKRPTEVLLCESFEITILTRKILLSDHSLRY